MAGGGHSSVQDAREQLVPKRDAEAEQSHSITHVFPRYDLPLPGTMPSASGVEKLPEVVDPNRNGYQARLEEASGSSKGAAIDGPTPLGVNGMPPPASTPPDLLTGPRPPMPSAGGSSVVAAMEIQEALLPPQPAAPFEHPISLPRRRWMVFMFCLVAALLFADQNLLAPNLTAAANYFGMNERQKDTLLGGALMAAFFAVGAPAALLVGWLADRGDINRRTLLFWVVVVGETPCLLTYWVREGEREGRVTIITTYTQTFPKLPSTVSPAGAAGEVLLAVLPAPRADGSGSGRLLPTGFQPAGGPRSPGPQGGD
ncbi:hypothetical protein Vafri_21012 [Volvox africanus]|uniref:Uncharacterized protein n=1 Tax=Volvox africanus TaxID=51714 RepID=A0A8J4BY74_9CHLO|nr:hypothetical protein Vafri_21012 [Volvox africanus]